MTEGVRRRWQSLAKRLSKPLRARNRAPTAEDKPGYGIGVIDVTNSCSFAHRRCEIKLSHSLEQHQIDHC